MIWLFAFCYVGRWNISERQKAFLNWLENSIYDWCFWCPQLIFTTFDRPWSAGWCIYYVYLGCVHTKYFNTKEIFPLHKTSGESMRDSGFLQSDQLSERPFMVKRRYMQLPLSYHHFTSLTYSVPIKFSFTFMGIELVKYEKNFFHWTQIPELY